MKKSVLWTIVAIVLILISIGGTIGIIAYKSASAEINEYNAHLEYMRKEVAPTISKTSDYVSEAADEYNESGDILGWIISEENRDKNYELTNDLEEAKNKLVMIDLEYPDARQYNKDQIKILDQLLITVNHIDMYFDEPELLGDVLNDDIGKTNELVEARDKHAEE